MARIRRLQVTDRATGDTVLTTEILPDDAAFEQRTRELRESLPVIDGVRLARLVCDGCGAVAVLDYGRPELPAGWQGRADGDFCPACASR